MTIDASLDKRLAQLGSGNYVSKIEALQAGSILDQAGAVLMQEEPVTRALGGYLQ